MEQQVQQVQQRPIPGRNSPLPLVGEGAPKGRERELRTRAIQHHASTDTFSPTPLPSTGEGLINLSNT